ncbi:hypothetical protein ACOSQ2_000261 [Xanthoceras sorbifolium]
MALIFPPCEAHKEFASLLSFQVNEEFAGYKLSLFAFYFMRPMLGSDKRDRCCSCCFWVEVNNLACHFSLAHRFLELLWLLLSSRLVGTFI